ncbi:MAG: fibronectin type III domain-containing protein [Blautia sp.]|nr:fibronectin type III domain-containing protein [Blautia sp.]
MNLRKKHRLLLLLNILALMFVLMPAGKASAATGINIISFSQKNRCVTLKWRPVNGATAYIITRKSADGQTGKIDNRSTIKYRQRACELNDTKFTSADDGKTFCYHLAAIDRLGKEIATGTRFLVKIPTCVITSLESTADGKVTLRWKQYNGMSSYKLQWAEHINSRAVNTKTRTISRDKSAATITGLKPKTKYIFLIQGVATGLYGTKRIQSFGWTSSKSIVMPLPAKLVLHYNDGSVYKEIQVATGENCTLPSMVNPKGYTFIGWGYRKGIFVNEDSPYETPYKAYNQICNIRGEKHLYAVLFDRSKEKDLSEAQMFSPNISKYKKVVFIGDSRTKCLEYMLRNLRIDADSKNIAFVAQSGTGLDWLKTDGYSMLLKKIDEINSSAPDDKRPIALVFNSGVNSLSHDPVTIGRLYVDFYKSIAAELKGKGCRLFFMSVNPVVSAQFETMYDPVRQEWRIRTFNATVSTGLKGIYTYLNTNTWLLRNGFSTDSGIQYDNGVDDGLHYTIKTYKRILRKALNLLESVG